MRIVGWGEGRWCCCLLVYLTPKTSGHKGHQCGPSSSSISLSLPLSSPSRRCALLEGGSGTALLPCPCRLWSPERVTSRETSVCSSFYLLSRRLPFSLYFPSDHILLAHHSSPLWTSYSPLSFFFTMARSLFLLQGWQRGANVSTLIIL